MAMLKLTWSWTWVFISLLVDVAFNFNAFVRAETVIVCENESGVLDCDADLILISSAVYGRTDAEMCGDNLTTDCVLDVSADLASCNGQTQCSIEAENDNFGDPCTGVHKYLNITYTCEDDVCGDDWVREPISGNCYLFTETREDWEDARDYCLNLGSDLASIHSAAENAFIGESISSHVWIGITDEASEDEFPYFTDGTLTDFTNFAENSHQSDNNDCVKLRHHSGVWAWKPCSSEFRAVCKKVPASPATTTPSATTTESIVTTPLVAPTPAYQGIIPSHETQLQATTQHSGVAAGTDALPEMADFGSTLSTTEGYGYMFMEVLEYPKHVASDGNIFQVNDTIVVLASAMGAFEPISSHILWSIKNHADDSVPYTTYSENAVLISLTAYSMVTIEATSVGSSSNLTGTAIATVPPTAHILCSSHVFASSEFWCALLTDINVDDSSYTFCFEDSEDSCSMVDPGYWSLADLPDALIDSASSMNGFLASFVYHTYTSTGSHNLTAMIFEHLISAIEVNVTVDPECISSLAIVKGNGNTTHPATYLKASDIEISAHIELNVECVDPMTSDFMWWILSSTGDNVVLAFQKITHTPQVTIPSGTLDYGTYKLKLKVQTRLRLSGAVTGEEYIATWLEIQPSPLVAVIKGGASRSHGLSSNLIVDGSTSYDPDVNLGSSSDLTFTWYCVVVSPDTIYNSLNEATQDEDDACFEDEGLIMDSTSSTLDILASKLEADVIMNIWLVASKGGRTSGTTQQRIELTQGLLPEVEISCINNCNMYFFSSERLVLHATCTNCDTKDVSFHWTLESDDTALAVDLASQTTTGLDQAYLVIKAHTFDSIMSDIESIDLRVTSYLFNSSSGGYAEFIVRFNAPPTSGSCFVTPNEGYALQTEFTVSCDGFSDVDVPLSYQIISYSSVDVMDGYFVGIGEGFQLYEGSESMKDGMSLPVGDGAHNHTVLLQVNVRDAYMASTSLLLSANVRTPTIDAAGGNITQELLNMTSSVESDVNTLLTVGDTGQAAQLISALGSILNSIGDDVDGDGEDGDEGRETRKEIRSSLVDSVASIPVESMASLRQSSAALAVVTQNKQEISTDVQVKAANALTEMTSFLKSESLTHGQDDIESAGVILVKGLSNIFSAAEETESLLSTNASLQDGEEYKTTSQKNLSEAALSAISDIQDAVVAGKIPSEEATIITSPTLSIAVGSISRDKLSEATLGGSDDDGLGSISMPSGDGVLDDTLDDINATVVGIQMSALRWNPFSWGTGGESMDSSIVGIQLKADNNIIQVQDLSADISVYLPVEETPTEDPVFIGITKDFSASLFVNHSSVPDGGALHLRVIAENEPLVFLSICAANISINETICVGNSTVVGVTDEELDSCGNFSWSIPAAQLGAADGIMISLYDGKDQPVYENDNITLSVHMHTSHCTFWNEDQEEWASSGCKVGPLSTPTSTHCLCNHLTFFGSSLFVPPNKINIFKDAKLFLTFVDNPIVVTFVVVILAGYVLVAVWARRKDKRDARRAAVTVLEDNNPYHQYRYDVTVVTGMRRGGGTTATVTLTLIGKKDRSEPHVLQDRYWPILTRGSTDSFLLTTAESLGDIQAIRMWHNNVGGSPQWYVSHCIVHDLESDERYYFICDTWMMVGGGGVGLDHTFNIASSKDLHKFGHLFTNRTVRDLRDGHLWLSVLMRPKHSNFTCLQRVSCCLSLLMCSMMTSIMFYGIPDDPADQVMDFGTFRITIKEIIIGIESSLIAFPINLLIVQIFRHIRPSIKLRTSAPKEKYVVKPEVAHSISSIDLVKKEFPEGDHADQINSLSSIVLVEKELPKSRSAEQTHSRCSIDSVKKEFPESQSVDPDISSTTLSTSHQSEEYESAQSHQQSQETVSGRFVGAGDSSSTSTADVNPEKSSATTSTSNEQSFFSLSSTLIHQETNESVSNSASTLGDCVPRSVSAVMKEWGDLDGVDQSQTLTRYDITSPSFEQESINTKEGMKSIDSRGYLTPQETAGVTHNYFLYSRLMGLVKGVTKTSSERFYKPEEHKQTMREAQTIFMTALDIDTPPISPDRSTLSGPVVKEKIKLKHRGLPHACVYIAWLLVLSTVLASSYITMLYGLKYGKQTSIDWLISLFIATFQSIFITQPIKVLFLAIFVSLIFKQIEPEEDFSDDIEELEVEDAMETHRALLKRRNTVAYYKPPATSIVTSHLKNKQLKARMYSLLWQIAGFLCFFYLLITITYSQKDRQAYWMTRGTKGLFFYHKNKDYRLICDFRSFLTWADSTLLPSLLSKDRWGAEKQSVLIGGGLRLRQVRVKPSSCETHPWFEDLINDCRAPFTPKSEDRTMYNASWSQPMVNMSALLNSSQTVEQWSVSNYSPWHFYPDKSVGMWGHTMTLPSRGYIWVLGTTYEDAKDSLAKMVDARWLDARTRALFVEWTSYNANTNLFCVVTFLMETPATGGLLLLPEVQVVRLHRYAANYKLFVIICEILFVLALLFVMYREYLRYKPIGICKYFSDKWNWLEVAIIINCYVSTGLYIHRYVITKQLFKQMRDESVRFVSFRSAATSDNALGYSLAIVIILSCVKFLYLLRLNPRMYLLTSVMSDSYHEVSAFILLLLVLILAFAFPMTIVFGSLPDYRDIVKSGVTLFNTLPGNFVYDDLMRVHRVLGPVALLIFQYWGYYLFLDLLIAALNESMVCIRRHPPPPSENRMIGLLLLSKIFSLLGIPERFHIGLD